MFIMQKSKIKYFMVCQIKLTLKFLETLINYDNIKAILHNSYIFKELITFNERTVYANRFKSFLQK